MAPKITLACESIDSVITRAASWISSIPRSSPPAMAKSTPLAPVIETSRSGELIASLAASSARFSPEDTPTPMRAEPAFSITERMSAKSTLMIPGIVMRSEIPSTACLRTLSHCSKAPRTVTSLSTIAKSRSLGMIMIASTSFFSSSIPCIASRIRSCPSKRKGLVTTPTVSAPLSRAILATIGAAPVPVPPPIPPVTKIMSEPLMALAISSRVSSAARRPISGLPPAPRPRVRFFPTWIFFFASE